MAEVVFDRPCADILEISKKVTSETCCSPFLHVGTGQSKGKLFSTKSHFTEGPGMSSLGVQGSLCSLHSPMPRKRWCLKEAFVFGVLCSLQYFSFLNGGLNPQWHNPEHPPVKPALAEQLSVKCLLCWLLRREGEEEAVGRAVLKVVRGDRHAGGNLVSWSV